MTIEDILKELSNSLNNIGISSSRLDSLLIIEKVIGKKRSWLLAHLDYQVSHSQLQKINKLLELRLKHKPLAYIFGQVEFYGRNFVVNENVLVPRPETETMIDLLKQLVEDSPSLKKAVHKLAIADIGTGSGAVGITAALEIPNSIVDLIDIDPQCLKVAKLNVDKYTLNIRTIVSNLLDKSATKYDILLCNLPYVPDGQKINKAATHEPKQAIFGGSDGLDVYRLLAQQVELLQTKPLYILIEAFPTQHSTISKIYRSASYKNIKSQDFIVVFKLL